MIYYFVNCDQQCSIEGALLPEKKNKQKIIVKLFEDWILYKKCMTINI